MKHAVPSTGFYPSKAKPGNGCLSNLQPPHRRFTWSQAIGFCSLLLALLLLTTTATLAQRQMENLNRGLVAVRTGSQVFVSWRLLGTEPATVGFNLYRGETLLNTSPITNSTNFVDNTSLNEAYTVRAVVNGTEQAASAPVTPWAQNYKTLPLQVPPPGTTPTGEAYTYSPNDCSVGDLDGDGEYEIIVKWDPSNAKDNSQSGYTGNVYLDAYKMDGTHMWRINLGRNIRAGAHYTQFMVYDLDSDGKAEVACKTGDATVDGLGQVIGNPDADYRNTNGYILTGPEYLTVFNGMTGAAMATTDYLPARGNVSSWGDSYGNRVDRFLAGVGYFDGERPSLLMTRGYYTRSVLVAWDWRNGQLTQRWIFDSNTPGNSAYAGQGNHSLSINDVDGDGKDEVVFGSMAIDDNGTGLYTTRLGHGDAQHVGDFLPDRPGLESWSAHESPSQYDGNGLWLRDARTGERLWGVPATGDVGRALTADINPNFPGNEMWGAAGNLYSATGQQISTSKPKMNFAIWWDGDLLREILDGDIMDKWNYNTNAHDRLFTIYNTGASKINGTKANPNLTADLFGDWREEMIYRHHENNKLLIFTTTIPTEHRLYTLMHDPQYRLSVAWQNVAYNQPPHTSYFLGHGMSTPLPPNMIATVTTGATNPVVSLMARGANAQVILSWTASDITINSQEVYRSLTADPAASEKIATLEAAARTYNDNTAANGTTYYYWLRATDANGPVISSNAATASPLLNFDGTFVVRAVHSGKVLDVANASTSNGGNVIQNTWDGANNQRWVFRSLGNGYHSIKNERSGKALDVSSASTATGANILQWDDNGANNQQWQLMAHANGRYSIIARHSGHAMEISTGSEADGANVQQGAYSTTKEFQQFTITDASTVTGLGNGAAFEKEKISIYPNPSTGAFTIEQQGAFEFTIFDYLGRVVDQGSGNGSIRTGTALKPGLYIIHIQTTKSLVQQKLLKR